MSFFRTFASGSKGNCSLFCDGKTKILIDAGISARKIKNFLSELGVGPEDITAILVTHEHFDHITALGTLEKYYDIPIYASTGTLGALRAKLPGVVPMVRAFTPGDKLYINSLEVDTFPTPHDAAESCGFRIFEENGSSVAVATDLGHVTEKVSKAISGAEIVLLESNHDLFMLKYGNYPPYLKERIVGDRGHLSNDSCGCAAAELVKSGTHSLILGHLSRENNTVSRAMETVCGIMTQSGIRVGEDIDVDVAPADEIGRKYEL